MNFKELNSELISYRKLYFIDLTLEELEPLLQDYPVEKKNFLRKILKIAKASPHWGSKLKTSVEKILIQNGLEGALRVCSEKLVDENKIRDSKKLKTLSYPEFLNNLSRILTYESLSGKNKKNIVNPENLNLVIGAQDAFWNLGYNSDSDSVTSPGETYYSQGKVLAPHVTPVLLKATKNPSAETISHVFRREVVDKTHLGNFLQYEFRFDWEGEASDLDLKIKVLKNHFMWALTKLGLEPEKIEFRPTMYHYVAPGIQVFYKLSPEKYVEVGGGGWFLPEVIKKYELGDLKQSLNVFAGAIGLDRVYSLITDKPLKEL